MWIRKYVYDSSKILCEIIQQSKRNIGSHTLAVNEETQWSFSLNFGESTLFLCHFWWAGKEKSIDVFNKLLHELFDKVCSWLVKEDGFYLFEGENLLHLHTWSCV